MIMAPSIILSKAVRYAVEKLSAKQKKAIYLKFWEGYSQRHISKTMGIPKNSVKKLQDNAIKQMRNIMLSKSFVKETETRNPKLQGLLYELEKLVKNSRKISDTETVKALKNSMTSV